MSDILKEEPKLLYIYEVIKKDPEYHYPIGEWIETEYDGMDKKFYRMVGTWRRTFVGNMQEFLNGEEFSSIKEMMKGINYSIEDFSCNNLINPESYQTIDNLNIEEIPGIYGRPNSKRDINDGKTS